jgi:hypothetical protein
MATALTPIAWQSLGTTATSVTFSSIPGTYRDLMLVCQYSTSSATYVKIQFNGDAGANYYFVTAYGNGTTTGGSGNSSQTNIYDNLGGNDNSTSLSLLQMHVLDYSTTDKTKTALVRMSNATSGSPVAEMSAQRWASTSAITSVVLTSNAGNFAIGSTFALYGVAG